MTMLDKILATLSVAGLVLFIGIVGWFVLEIDLIIVFVIGGLMATYDFVRSFRGRGGNGG